MNPPFGLFTPPLFDLLRCDWHTNATATTCAVYGDHVQFWLSWQFLKQMLPVTVLNQSKGVHFTNQCKHSATTNMHQHSHRVSPFSCTMYEIWLRLVRLSWTSLDNPAKIMIWLFWLCKFDYIFVVTFLTRHKTNPDQVTSLSQQNSWNATALSA